MRSRLLTKLVLLTIASNVYAIPYETNKHPAIFELSLTGAGLVVPTDNTAYAVQAYAFSDEVPSGNLRKNDPEFKFGGEILLGYYFPCSSINWGASYAATKNHTSEVVYGVNSPILIPAGFIAASGGSFPYLETSTNFSFDYDLVNVEIGSLTRVGLNGLIMNPKLGVSYSYLKNQQEVGYAHSTTAPAAEDFNVSRESKFSGVGPSFGIDLHYISNDEPISLMGGFRYNALVGNVSSDNFVSSADPSFFSDVTINSKKTLVNVFQAEISVGYDFDLYNTDAFCGNISIGYQLTKIFGNVEQIAFVDAGNGSILTDAILNTAIHGYFVRLTMDFGV